MLCFKRVRKPIKGNFMSKKQNQPKQGELFKAETTWFHVFKSMIDSGDMAALDGSAVKCYLVIKSHTNFSTGRAFPSIETIGKDAGLSKSQVLRCISQLVEMGYVTKTKVGRHNDYRLREKIEVKDAEGRPVASATWDYLPTTVRDAVAELRNVVATGDFNGVKVIQIANLNLSLVQQIGNHNTLINVTDTMLDDIRQRYPDLAESLSNLRKNMPPKG